MFAKLFALIDANLTEYEKSSEERPNEIADWIQAQSSPVIIMHHESPTAAHFIQRNLATANVTALNEFQISQYQVCKLQGVLLLYYIKF